MSTRISQMCLAAAAAVFIMVAGAPAGSEEDKNAMGPHFEIEGGGGTDGSGGTAYLEIDGVIPLQAGGGSRSVLFLQPGGILSHGHGDGTLYGVSLGVAYRFETAGGVVGLNAFYDRNWLRDSGGNRAHDRASIGADYRLGRSRLGANYYFPLSDETVWSERETTLLEYAAGGPEVRYRLALNDRWAVTARTLYEVDPGARLSDAEKEDAWRVAVGASYRFDCTRIGLDAEHDTRRGETAVLVGVSVSFGAGDNARRCAAAEQRGHLALVERSKTIATRQLVTVRRIVPLTTLPDDVEDLFVIDEGGATDADTAWLLLQGGPISELSPHQVHSTLKQFDGHESKLLVQVHQVQTLNPHLFEDPRLDSVEKAVAEMDLSVEILHRVIRHFEEQGKKVVVFSHSFGSLIVPRYLARKGTAAADRYVIMAGRLDMEDIFWEDRLALLHDSTKDFFHLF